jgi:hypothetical protein
MLYVSVTEEARARANAAIGLMFTADLMKNRG